MKTFYRLLFSAGIVIVAATGCENNGSNSTVTDEKDYNHGAGVSTGSANPTNSTTSTHFSSTAGNTAPAGATTGYTTASGTDSDANWRTDSGHNTGKKDGSEELNNRKKGNRGSTGSGGSGGTTGSTTKDR